MQRPLSQILVYTCDPALRTHPDFLVSPHLQLHYIICVKLIRFTSHMLTYYPLHGKNILKIWISYCTLGYNQPDKINDSSTNPSRTRCYTMTSTLLPQTLGKKKPSLTEFRQPLQVQSHLEMPGILVQLGHIQRT